MQDKIQHIRTKHRYEGISKNRDDVAYAMEKITEQLVNLMTANGVAISDALDKGKEIEQVWRDALATVKRDE